MVTPKETVLLGSEKTDGVSGTASIGDTESFDIASPASTRKARDGSSSFGMPPLPPRPPPDRTRSRSVLPPKAMMTTAAKTAMQGTLNAAKRAVPHLIAHKLDSSIADVAKKRKRVDIDGKRSQEPQSKKAFRDTGGIDINALIEGFGGVRFQLYEKVTTKVFWVSGIF